MNWRNAGPNAEVTDDFRAENFDGASWLLVDQRHRDHETYGPFRSADEAKRAAAKFSEAQR